MHLFSQFALRFLSKIGPKRSLTAVMGNRVIVVRDGSNLDNQSAYHSRSRCPGEGSIPLGEGATRSGTGPRTHLAP